MLDALESFLACGSSSADSMSCIVIAFITEGDGEVYDVRRRVCCALMSKSDQNAHQNNISHQHSSDCSIL